MWHSMGEGEEWLQEFYVAQQLMSPGMASHPKLATNFLEVSPSLMTESPLCVTLKESSRSAVASAHGSRKPAVRWSLDR